MECGAQDALCELVNWASRNELVGPWLVEVVGRFGQHASGVAGEVSQFVRDYGQSIVGLVGVTFGFWRWWRYREHILHKRLAEYLRENDARLAAGTADLVEIIQRPAPGQQFRDPLFIDDDLRTVLRERNWDRPIFALSVATSSDWQLAKAIKSIERRLGTALAATTSLNRQLVSAYTIRGAIAASQARGRRIDKAHERALGFFRSALSVPDSDRNPLVKELEAHQQRKLELPTAEQAYKDFAALVQNVENSRDRNLLTARAKRFLAEIVRPSYPKIAWLMLTAAKSGDRFFPGALHLISSIEPLSNWERLEKGDTHYFAALCANQLRFPVAEPFHLGEAETAYQRVLNELSDRRRRWPGSSFSQLHKGATDGIKRVEDARKGVYDFNWLPAD
jgi:hypothetical protein